tara:strand:+ start:389 stop:490 length:102 start_codon:yes stop_codon:yes gene_type:complete
MHRHLNEQDMTTIHRVIDEPILRLDSTVKVNTY